MSVFQAELRNKGARCFTGRRQAADPLSDPLLPKKISGATDLVGLRPGALPIGKELFAPAALRRDEPFPFGKQWREGVVLVRWQFANSSFGVPDLSLKR